MPINQPSNQIKLTNVALVRMKKGKKRYEIACYKNKVSEWRSGVEKDIDNVLQIPNVFVSVSKGQTAPSQDLAKSFGPKVPLDDIILEILNKGEEQVGEKERQAQLERIHNEVIDIVAGKLVDPRTKRVYTTGMIEKALDQLSSQRDTKPTDHKGDKSENGAAAAAKPDIAKEDGKPKPQWTGVTEKKSAKMQALDAMKALIAHQPIPIARARMRLRITCPSKILKQTVKVGAGANTAEGAQGEAPTKKELKQFILDSVEQLESQEVVGSEFEVVGAVEPGMFKVLSDVLGAETKGHARVEVLEMSVVHDGD